MDFHELELWLPYVLFDHHKNIFLPEISGRYMNSRETSAELSFWLVRIGGLEKTETLELIWPGAMQTIESVERTTLTMPFPSLAYSSTPPYSRPSHLAAVELYISLYSL
jgi:hypothetical protein